ESVRRASAREGHRPAPARLPRLRRAHECIHSRAAARAFEGKSMSALLNERIARFDSPFRRLDRLLADIVPNPQLAPINMSVGEPQDSPPPFLAEAVAASAHLWNRYPPVAGTPEFRAAVQGYLERRYAAVRGRIDALNEITPVTSTREALYLA